MNTEDTDTIVTCGLILKTTLQTWDAIKRSVHEDFPDVVFIYQKVGVGPLRIVSNQDNEL